VSDILACDMRLEHIDDVLVIEKLSFKTPWTRDAFTMELTNNKCSLYRVITNEDKVVAYGGMWILLDEGHITNIAVHPEYRGTGLGDKILEDMICISKGKGIDSMTLEVRISNISAINLYKKHGFIEVAIRKGYYQDTNEDGIIMWKYNIQDDKQGSWL
jgi:[ribosomal protein S18]-alanine N-acetyltransferase